MAEPTPAQIRAAAMLAETGWNARVRAYEFGQAIDQLREAVTVAHAAGIPKKDVPPLVSGMRSLPGEVGEHLRVIIRRIYQ